MIKKLSIVIFVFLVTLFYAPSAYAKTCGNITVLIDNAQGVTGSTTFKVEGSGTFTKRGEVTLQIWDIAGKRYLSPVFHAAVDKDTGQRNFSARFGPIGTPGTYAVDVKDVTGNGASSNITTVCQSDPITINLNPDPGAPTQASATCTPSTVNFSTNLCNDTSCTNISGRCVPRSAVSVPTPTTIPTAGPTSAPLPPPCALWEYTNEDDESVKNKLLPHIKGSTSDATDPKLRDPKFSKRCLKVKTAIGVIDANPADAIKNLFGILLGISGGIALLLIISSGFNLMTSQGDAEKIKGARETITSAIVGLLFMIFSIVLLQIIGVDILRIPGFTP